MAGFSEVTPNDVIMGKEWKKGEVFLIMIIINIIIIIFEGGEGRFLGRCGVRDRTHHSSQEVNKL